MEQPETKKYLEDVLQCINEIKLGVRKVKNLQTLKSDFVLKRFIEREFEIIGEALNKCLKLDANIKIREIKRIIGLRNLIIHSYDTVDYIILWQIIKDHLDNLESDVIQELKKY
jgi:uncharacterized protein with HEPN domain